MASAALTVRDERPPLALELPDGLDFDEWVKVGRRLCASSQVINWHIGDWWNYGVHAWGETDTRKAAQEIWGVEGETARKCGWVASKYPPQERRPLLSFRHHEEVATLPSPDELLFRAEQEGLSTRDLRREVMRIRTRRVHSVEKLFETPAPQSLWAELMRADEIIIELAEALGGERALSEREQGYLDRARLRMKPAPQYESVDALAQSAGINEDIAELLFIVTGGDRKHLEVLRGADVDRETSQERSAIVWVLREHTTASFPQIGRALACDHSAMVRAYDRAEERRCIDSDFAIMTDRLASKFRECVTAKRGENRSPSGRQRS